MKNIQVIDGATNSGYWIYQASEKAFLLIFPAEGQNIEFIEDFVRRTGRKEAGAILAPLWKRRVPKVAIIGIHGTLFYQLGFKKVFYPNKRDTDFDDAMIQGKAPIIPRSKGSS